MKISVVTVCRNAAGTIEDAIKSVAAQSYPDKEHIIVDGGSDDTTVDIIKQNTSLVSRWISEPDKGIYDAMNKGVRMATGEVIGFLNADDIYYHNNVLERVASILDYDEIQACFSNLVYVRDDLETVVRVYNSGRFSPKMLAFGWMPAHPTLYIRKELFNKYGLFKIDYRIAADFELVARLFWQNRVIYRYVPDVWVKMRMGGISTQGWRSNLLLNQEIVRACRDNGIDTSLPRVLLKYPLKMLELFGHRRKSEY